MVNSKSLSGAINTSTILPCDLACPILDAELAKAFCKIVIIINPGAIKLANGTLLIVSTDLPKANEKTAKKSKELTAGPMIV